MSNNDSFIDEVTEEVRRDKLFALFRRYGWIGIVAILGIVGASAFSEWRKAQAEARAQAFGDRIITALTTEDAAQRGTALAAVPAETKGQAAVLRLLEAAESQAQKDPAAAAKALAAIAKDDTLPESYRQIATLKWIAMDPAIDAAARDSMLADLARPGAPFRPLAMEQQALVLAADGKTDEALAAFRAILQEPTVTAGLRRRAREVIVALGGDPDAKE